MATNAIRFSFGVIRPQREFAIPYTKCHAATAKRAETGAECRVYKHFCTKQQAFVGCQTASEIFRLEAVAFISIACMCTGKNFTTIA
ncbi:hypothetical protein HGG76_02045 [Ochrobactrum tritici]|uniref:Uncharacterized protein n=1 Tax=Brucella tritici TaxID=94626 RepID=A0A7X6FRQ0_9HYPH|nr:hypothetical protein [Brucella tritici]